jgi:hypothetical protein
MVARMNEYTPALVASFPSCGFRMGPVENNRVIQKAVQSEKCVGVSSQNVTRHALDPYFWPACPKVQTAQFSIFSHYCKRLEILNLQPVHQILLGRRRYAPAQRLRE